MITGRVQKDAERAKKYYAEHLDRSEYYSEGHTVGLQWFGQGCVRLGLEPGREAQPLAFERLCDNLNPVTGEKLNVRHRNVDRRVSFDFVVSPPKSVSLMTLLAGDLRIIAIHEEAARVAMGYLEKVAATRIRKGRADTERNTGELAAVMVTHGSSRDLDPQLHSHFVVFNTTWDATENRWKALQTTEMFNCVRMSTEVYRSQLARGLVGLGYELRPGVHSIEINGVSQSLIDRFSKRRNTIRIAESRLTEKLGKEVSNNGRARLAQATRDWKDLELSSDKILQRQLREITESELADLRRLIPTTTRPVAESSSLAAEAIDYARDHLFERKSVVSKYDLFETALRFGAGRVVMSELEAEMNKRVEFIENDHELTTYDMLQKERQLIGLVNEGVGRSSPMRQRARLSAPLNGEQLAVYRDVMESSDRVVSIRGVAGAGKTVLLAALAQGIKESGREAIVMAPTSEACRALRENGIPWATTVENVRTNPNLQASAKAGVMIVDEAGLVSVQDALAILRIAKDAQCRVILCGDSRQLTGIGAGDALRILEQRSSLQSFGLPTVRRQKPALYRKAIQAFAEGNGREGFRLLEEMNAVHQVAEEDPFSQLTSQYLDSVKRGKDALIVSPLWQHIEQITIAVRAQLKAANRLSPDDSVVEVHRSLKWTLAQKRDFRNYKKGMVIHFHRDSKLATKGTSLRVTSSNSDSIVAKRPDGREVKLTRKQTDCFDVQERRDLHLAKGDVILLQGSRKAAGLFNGQTATVRSIHRNGAIELTDGRIVPPDFRTFTHGYCSTSFGSQGRTVDHVFLYLNSSPAKAVNRNQFYVSASRASEAIQIYTDDVDVLRSAITRGAERTSASELLDKIRQQQAPEISVKKGVRV